MAKIFTNSFVQPVYFQVGEKDGKKLFKRAPFDIVQVNGSPHIQPRSIGTPDGALTAFTLGSVEDQNNWREGDMGGYETLEPIVLGEHQMGDGSDNWIGLHRVAIL